MQISLTPSIVVCVTMVILGWWMELILMKEEWRCVQTTRGEQSVVALGMVMMPALSVLSWDTRQQVSTTLHPLKKMSMSV